MTFVDNVIEKRLQVINNSFDRDHVQKTFESSNGGKRSVLGSIQVRFEIYL